MSARDQLQASLDAYRTGLRVTELSLPNARPPEQVKPAPEMGSALNTDHLIGLGTVDQRMLILVDIDKLMSSSEMGLLDKLAA